MSKCSSTLDPHIACDEVAVLMNCTIAHRSPQLLGLGGFAVVRQRGQRESDRETTHTHNVLMLFEALALGLGLN